MFPLNLSKIFEAIPDEYDTSKLFEDSIKKIHKALMSIIAHVLLSLIPSIIASNDL